MPRGKKKGAPGTNGTGKKQTKLGAARVVMRSTPTATAPEMARSVKEQFGFDLTPKMAANYRYTALKEMGGRRGRRGAVAASAARTTTPRNEQAGIDDLLQAAQKLGWQRVKEVVDSVIQAPA
jgi:hypothetical protein